MRRAFVLAALALLVLAFACDRTTADAGRDAALQVEDAQFFREAPPRGESGPAVKTVAISPVVPAGAAGRHCSGDTAPTASAVAISLAGDIGYWIVPTGAPDIASPGAPTFTANVSFAKSLAPGPHDVVVRGVDVGGHFGPPQIRTVDIRPAIPAGRLVIALKWGNDADLDLHVVLPGGVEIFDRDINSYVIPPPGAPPELPNTPHDGGVIDFDSNAQCIADGLRAENAVWKDLPPPGHYLVRVVTASLCSLPYAYWTVEAFLDGVRIGGAEGESTDSDTRFPDQRGAGVTALELDVPPL